MIVKNKKGVYQIQELLLPGLIHGFSPKSFGNMSFKYGEKEETGRNRQKFLASLDIMADYAYAGLVHGTKVTVADKAGVYAETDGLITSKIGLPLMLLTADCLPVLFFDPTKRVIGLAHAGYKGVIGKIFLSVIGKMVSVFDCKPKDIFVGIGPTIEKCCYVESRPLVQESLLEWQDFLSFKDNNTASIDLSGFTIEQLKNTGVKQIFQANYCTKDHSDEFFCSQLETAGIEKPGRFATVILMV